MRSLLAHDTYDNTIDFSFTSVNGKTTICTSDIPKNAQKRKANNMNSVFYTSRILYQTISSIDHDWGSHPIPFADIPNDSNDICQFFMMLQQQDILEIMRSIDEKHWDKRDIAFYFKNPKLYVRILDQII